MIVIADTGPVNYLVLIGHVEVLPQLFGRVVIPQSVFQELQRPRSPDPVRTWIAHPPVWLDVRTPQQPTPEDLGRLGAGERDAILLAEEIGADWLILDDAEGRKNAQRRDVRVIGTLRVLDAAGAQQLIDLEEAVARLQKTNFYLSPELIEWLLRRAAEQKARRGSEMDHSRGE